MLVIPANDNGIGKALAVIKRGGIVAHPTETCYGFACDLTNPEAVSKLSVLKKRPKGQPISALFSSIEEAAKWVEWNEKAEELAAKYLPGPLTIILPLRKTLLGWSTLGIRISSHPIAMKLAELAGVPLSTTSANLHGQPNPYALAEIVRQFTSENLQPDLLLDGGTLPQQPPSTVLVVKKGKIE